VKIIVAMDSFKGSLIAEKACEAVRAGLLSTVPELEIVCILLADGGEGTARALMAAQPGRWVEKEVMGPLPHIRTRAGFVAFDDGTALVEMASASGLELLRAEQRNPFATTTYGTGELIKAAAADKPTKIMLAVGGSATVDGGVGAAMALGWKFLDENGRMVGLGGGQLSKIREIVPPQNLSLPPVEVLCDVENRLCGKAGAARVFGPQKGADEQMVVQLEEALKHLAELVKDQLGKDIDVPRAGASGGLAAGAIAFMDAKLVSGIDKVIQYVGLQDHIRGADWVITGEGCFDHQSLAGKVVSGVVRLARTEDVPVAVLAGSVLLEPQEYRRFGVTTAIGIRKTGMSKEYAISHAWELLEQAAAEFASQHLTTSS